MLNAKQKQLQKQKEEQEKEEQNKKDFMFTETPVKDITILTHTEQGFGPKKNECQDTICVLEDIVPKTHFFAVFDGHGESGQSASVDVNSSFTSFFQEEKRRLEWLKTYKLQYEFIMESFAETTKKLRKSLLSYDESGTCAITVFMHQNHLYIGNLGDSKAVVYREKCKKDVVNKQCIELSTDQNAYNKEERNRIMKKGGRIYKNINREGEPVGPLRIWENEDDATGPGIAITRSFGDYNAKKIGSTSVPVIEYFQLCEDDQFLIMGSDGLFDVFETYELCGFVKSYMEDKTIEFKDEIVNELVNMAKKRWINKNHLEKMPNSRDDISIILVFFNFTDKKMPFKQRYTNTFQIHNEKSKIKSRVDMSKKFHEINTTKFKNAIPQQFNILKTEIRALQGTPQMSIFGGTIAFGAGLAANIMFWFVLRETENISYGSVVILGVMPTFSGTISRLYLGYNIVSKGGKLVSLIMSCISLVGCTILYIASQVQDLKTMTNSDLGFYLMIIGGFLSGTGIANYQLIVNSVFWSPLKIAGKVQSIQAGFSTLMYGIYGILITVIMDSSGITTVFFITIVLYIVLIGAFYFTYQNPLQVQLKDQKMEDNDAKMVAEYAGQENFPTEVNMMKSLKDPISLTLIMNYFYVYGSFLSVGTYLLTFLQQYHGSEEQESYIQIYGFSIITAISLIATGYIVDKIGGYKLNQLGIILICLGTLILVFSPTGNQYNVCQMIGLPIAAIGFGISNSAIYKWIVQVQYTKFLTVSTISGTLGSIGFIIIVLIMLSFSATEDVGSSNVTAKPENQNFAFLIVTFLGFITLGGNFLIQRKLMKE